MKSPGMLITDDEILERFGDVLPKLDQGRKTKAYQPFWNGMRNRAEVEKALSAPADRA